MKLGVFNPALYDRNFADACKFLKDNGVTAIEIGCGGFPGRTHCNPDILLNDEKEYNKLFRKLQSKFDKEELEKQIKNKLYQKGYNLSEINEFLSTK